MNKSLFEEQWDIDLGYDELEEEICEYIKGDFKTIVVCKFNKEGYLVSHTTECVDISDAVARLNNARESLMKALDDGDLLEVKAQQEIINKLRTVNEIRKPTI